MDSNLQRRFLRLLPCPPPSCSARCLILYFGFRTVLWQSFAKRLMNYITLYIAWKKVDAKNLWSLELAGGEVGQKVKTSSALLLAPRNFSSCCTFSLAPKIVSTTFVCSLYIRCEWMLNVQCFNFHPTYCHLPTLMMSWEVHKRWCSSAGWWREHREPVWVKFLTRIKIKWWIIVALPGLEVPWRPEHFAHGPC